MRYAATALAALALTACGGHSPPSAESVARAWSAALDRADDNAAARLFAPSAVVVQDGELVLRSHADAVAWNSALPCGGRITRVISQQKDQVLVVFRLTERPGHRCDAPGVDAAAVFRVEHGKIVLWHQAPPPGEAPPSSANTPV